MEWAGAFMRVAIGVFFLLFGLGLAFALYRLAELLAEAMTTLRDFSREIVPILTRFQTTVDEVNSELGKIDDITGSVASVTDTLEHTTVAIQTAIGTPVKKVAGLSAGVSEAVSAFLAGRRKEA